MLLLVSLSTRDEAETLGEDMVTRGLATRGTVVAGAHSFFMVGDRLERAHEALLLLTTSSERAAEAERYVHENHAFGAPHVLRIALVPELR